MPNAPLSLLLQPLSFLQTRTSVNTPQQLCNDLASSEVNLRLWSRIHPYLSPFSLLAFSRPEQVWTHPNSSALIWLLQKFGCSQSTLCTQGLMILLAKTTHLLKCAYYESYGGQLCFRITDLILVQSKCLEEATSANKCCVSSKKRERDSKTFQNVETKCPAKGHQWFKKINCTL